MQWILLDDRRRACVLGIDIHCQDMQVSAQASLPVCPLKGCDALGRDVSSFIGYRPRTS